MAYQAPAPLQQQATQRIPIITLRYNGAAPPPHQPCTEPTPDEEYQHLEQSRQQLHEQKAQQAALADQAPAPEGGAGAFFRIARLATKVTSVVEKTASDIHSKSEKELRDVVRKRNAERFATHFPELVASGDQLITNYTCKAMHQGQQIAGDIMVTTRALLFLSDTLREIIPFQEIASVQRSIALETVDNGPPFIMPIPAPHVVADTIQVFTVKQQVFQFLDFKSYMAAAGSVFTNTIKGKPIDRMYNFLDHAWRQGVQVPLPGVQYAPY